MALKRSLGLLGVLALVVSACSGGTTATTPPAGTPAAGGSAPASAAAQSGDLKFVMDAEPTYFSLAYTDLPTAYINGEIYTGMYRVNNKLAVIPDMATALPTISADGLTWTITLKDGIKWQNGDPFTSADVVFTFQLAASPNCTFIPSFCSDIQGNVASVTAPDAKTVVFTLKQKFAPFLVTDLTTLIMPQKAVMASFATFQQSSSAVSASDVKALDDQITTATTDKACDGSANQPASCDYATYVSQMEAILQKAGVGLGSGQLNKTLYVKSDGTPDNTAYGNALYNALADLDKTLAATQTDQVAAAFRLLDFQNKPVGTGPFMFDNYQPGQSVTLDANPNYYAGTVPPQHMYFPIIKDAASGAAALQKGDANWLYSVVSDALPALQADPTIQMATYADFGYYFIAFNLRPGHIYSDINLREAFSMCIDHDATVSKATDGQGIPVYADIPPASWAFDPNAPKYTLDVAGAKAKIESSGWTLGADGIYTKGGQRLSTTLYVRAGRPQRISFANLAKDQLKACGIEINVLPSDFSTVLLPLLSYPNKFDTYLGGWSTALDPDDSSIFGCNQITTKANPNGNNFPGWCDQQADALLTQGRETTDQAQRTQIYSQFQAIVHNEVPYYFLWADQGYSALSKSITGGTNSVVTDPTIDLKSPLYYWNSDAWTVATQ
ncbi:MAG TPA: peptide ABC transporter substrate-binding protein [Candidatus Limnocylindrales bacterium]|nr:peptide ABC transporter substrate-binding protein [Candidatus Limnocylindrales bacterium]